MKLLDLFSGIGGFSLAARWAGIETIQFVEKDPFCQKVLAKNFPHVPIHDDIKTFHCSQKVDLITGGFPCQGFSIAGKRKGKEDARYLWPEMFRVIKESNPQWIIAENVTGIISIALDTILMELENENYSTETFIIPASAAKAPHKRERVWIIANRHGKRCNLWCDYREERFNQENIDRNISTLQSEWEELKPQPWKIMQANEWLSANADFSRINNGVPNRVDRIRSLGNAIVPQVVFPILKIIKLLHEDLNK